MMFELVKDSRWEGFFGQEKFFDGRISWYFLLQRMWQNGRMRGYFKFLKFLAFPFQPIPHPPFSTVPPLPH